ncbi:MAG TPA: NYN domain-containing protein [Nodosilinea sp.]|nr:NYN domain-containing protein [Nodosilinea sp.]
MTPSPESPLERCGQMACLLHHALLAAQRQRPGLLTEVASHWLQTTSAEVQLAKLTNLLQQPPAIALLQTVERLLDKLFVPEFKGTKPYNQILQRAQELMLNGGDSVEQTPLHQPLEPSTAGAGLLLVDAENMTLPEALEDFLQTVGQYPILHRLAFGNWRRLGRRDRDLYQRGYQMVHVPSGKNSTDIKMSLDAASISLWNPSIREVYICSTDTDLLHLGYALLSLGVTPYRVSRRHNGWFDVLNLANQTTQVFAPTQDAPEDGKDGSGPEAEREVVGPSLSEMRRWLKILILQEQQAHPDQPVTLARLGKLFRDRNQISAHAALRANSGYKTLRQFLEAHEAFELSLLPDGQQLAVTLKAPAVPPPAPPPIAALAPQPQGETAPPLPITDAATLEQALVSLLKRLSSGQLSSGQPDGHIRLSVLAAYFAHVYQEPMSAVLKRIGEPKGLPKFLAKCRSLQVQKHSQDWQITLACVSIQSLT